MAATNFLNTLTDSLEELFVEVANIGEEMESYINADYKLENNILKINCDEKKIIELPVVQCTNINNFKEIYEMNKEEEFLYADFEGTENVKSLTFKLEVPSIFGTGIKIKNLYSVLYKKNGQFHYYVKENIK